MNNNITLFKEAWIPSPEDALCQFFIEIYLVVLKKKMDMWTGYRQTSVLTDRWTDGRRTTGDQLRRGKNIEWQDTTMYVCTCCKFVN